MSQQQYGYAGQPPYQQPASNPNMGYAPAPGWAPPPPGQQQQQQGQGGVPFMPPPMPRMPPPGTNESYVESNVKRDFGFDDKTIRAAFIRKVFSLVAIMLFVVAAMSAVGALHTGTKLFIRNNVWLYYVSYATFLVTYIALMCCESVRRRSPGNLIATAVLTLAIGYMTMMLCAMYDLTMVMMALGITVGCCVAIVIFATQTKYDLTGCMGIMFVVSMVLFLFGIVAIMVAIFAKSYILYTVYAGLAALLFMVYLAIDIQMIMGGRKVELSPEEYIFAAIQVFLDVVYIFWMLLSLLGGANSD